MLSKINLSLILILIVVLGISFSFLNSKISDQNQIISENDQKVENIETFIEGSGPDCEIVRHENEASGDQICEREQYQFCLTTLGQVQEYFYESKDLTCSGGYAKDFDTRLFDCKLPIPPVYYRNQDTASAMCLSGGMFGTDFRQTLSGSESICCKNTVDGKII